MDVAPVRHSLAWRASFASVLAGMMAVATYVFYAFGVLGPFLVEDLGLSRTRLGLLVTAQVLVATALSTPAGRLVDRVGGRRVLLGGAGVALVAAVVMALAPTYWVLALGGGLAGLALAAGNPVTNKLIGAHLPVGARGTTMGVKQAGVQVGAFVFGIALPPLAAATDWRVAMASTALLPGIVLLGTLVAVPVDAVADDVGAPQAVPSRPLPPAVAWLAVYASLMGASVAAFTAYLPLYGTEAVGLSAEVAGLVAAVSGAMGVASRIAWGRLSEGVRSFAPALAGMAASAVIATILLAVATPDRVWPLWAGALLFAMGAVTWNVVGMLAVVALVAGPDQGRASGWVQTGFYAGFVVGPLVFGALADRTGAYGWSWTVAALAFVAAALSVGMARRSLRMQGAAGYDGGAAVVPAGPRVQ